MLESSPARRLASSLAVLLAVLLCWPLLWPSSAAAETLEFSELREADDSENEAPNCEEWCTSASALELERGDHRVETLTGRDSDVPPGHVPTGRQRGPPSFE